jgi:hypothetical protein
METTPTPCGCAAKTTDGTTVANDNHEGCECEKHKRMMWYVGIALVAVGIAYAAWNYFGHHAKR